MRAGDKPKVASGYEAEETEQVKSVLLTVAVILGDLMDDLCIVGGLVPGLLIDERRAETERPGHPGTSDLDVALAVALLDEERYKEIAERLRGEGFEPDTSDGGAAVLQRWRLGDLQVTIDFLIPPADDARGGTIKHLESDFGAVVTPGLQVAFLDVEAVVLTGTTLKGESVTRTISICGPGAFVLLKSSAFQNRGEEKDAYDLVYVIAYWPDGAADLARRIFKLARTEGDFVAETLGHLANNFKTLDEVGARRAARFEDRGDDEEDDRAADAVGHVDDLLRACDEAGVRRDSPPGG